MSESIGEKKVFSLYEVAKSIGKTLSGRYSSAYWIKAEMNKLNYYQYSGHCYPDLIEKADGKVIAQFRAVLWNTDYRRINHQFLRLLHEPLKDGIKILFQANIMYDPVHGISLRILDVDAGFTLGDLEREKQETIAKLKEEGIYQQNKQLPFPLLPARIAIISVETSKGYADFLKIMDHNDYGYRFFHFLFPSLLQGERAVEAMLAQLRRIRKVQKHFDVVAIIRGGGGEVGLSCYNDYRLAKAIATFPLPVLTGIGHATNETVAEMVAYTNGITPTKIAEYLIRVFNDFSFPLEKASDTIVQRSRAVLNNAHTTFASDLKMFRQAAKNIINTKGRLLKHAADNVTTQSLFLFKNNSRILAFTQEKIENKSVDLLRRKRDTLASLETNIRLMDPKNVLKRGYSITRLNGKALRSIDEIKPGDRVITQLLEGEVESTVQALKKDDNGTN